MPWVQQPMKDAVTGETPRGVGTGLDPWDSEWGNPYEVMLVDGVMNT